MKFEIVFIKDKNWVEENKNRECCIKDCKEKASLVVTLEGQTLFCSAVCSNHAGKAIESHLVGEQR